MSGRAALTERQRVGLAVLLRAKRDEIRKRRLVTEVETPDEEADPLDVATGVRSDAEVAGISENDVRILSEIEDALARMESGTYGISEDTGDPIPIERLRAIPWARRTAEEEERNEARAR